PHSAPPPPGTVAEVTPVSLVVATGGGYLSLGEVQLEGKKRLPVAEFLKGYHLTPRLVLGVLAAEGVGQPLRDGQERSRRDTNYGRKILDRPCQGVFAEVQELGQVGTERSTRYPQLHHRRESGRGRQTGQAGQDVFSRHPL